MASVLPSSILLLELESLPVARFDYRTGIAQFQMDGQLHPRRRLERLRLTEYLTRPAAATKM
jgi:hypothetical protein